MNKAFPKKRVNDIYIYFQAKTFTMNVLFLNTFIQVQ